jgi:hypothetical protein
VKAAALLAAVAGTAPCQKAEDLMSEKLLLTNMHICGREIAQVFAAELSVEARTRMTENC